MKLKLIFLFFIIILNASPNFGQIHQFYASVGYNFPTTTEIIGQFSDLESTKINKSSFSKGMVFQVGYGLGITENFFLELNVNYLTGVSDEKYTSEVIDGTAYPGLSGEESSASYSNSNLSIAPSIKIKTSFDKFSPYLKIGVSINFITIKDKWINPPPLSYWSNITTTKEYEYSNDYTFGWVSGLGLSYLIQPGIAAFGEFQFNGITFYATEVKYNGEIYELKDEIPYGFPEDLSWAEKGFPFSSIGILIGLSVSI
jgi:hypothetical protein